MALTPSAKVPGSTRFPDHPREPHMLSDEYSGTHKDTLTRRRAADVEGWESDNAKVEEQFELVVKALRTDDASRQPAPKPKL